MKRICAGVIAALFFLLAAHSLAADAPPEASTREVLVEEAAALQPLLKSDLAQQFVKATKHLPAVEDRLVHFNRAAGKAMTAEEAEAVDEEALADFVPMRISERFYYLTRYGSPLAYGRAIDLAAKFGLESADGKRIFDFGYGGIGHLRMLASLGANVVGVEVDDLLRAAYSMPEDTGTIPRAAIAGEGAAGKLTLVHGFYPADEIVRRRVGTGFDLVISKNVLKRGYIHPERPADPRMLVQLGVDDETFLREIFNAMAPGALFVTYNLSPAKSKPDEPYKPWSDGRFPFERTLAEAIGFDVLAFDENDDAFAREMARALGWAERMDVENDLFGLYTVLRRPE